MKDNFGPLVDDEGTLFRLWAPSQRDARLMLENRDSIAMERADQGMWQTYVRGVQPGTRYRFGVDGYDFPDPASRQQDGDNAGWSVVRGAVGSKAHSRPVRPWHEAIICEVHIGTATEEGTFAALTDKLEHFRDAGYTCLEIMPISAFPGRRNWGYDGTLLFAPASAYGTPADLRRLVDRAHELELTMVLDVVYNHFGETNNAVRRYAPEWFSEKVSTPWGAGVNFDEPMVRQFYYENAAMWLADYDFDGLRFDSVHEIKTDSRPLFLSELADAARAAKEDAILIIENVRNSFRWIERDQANKPVHFLAQWNDDMHHVLVYLTTGEGRRTGYDDPNKDPYADLEKALANGFVHDPTEGDNSDGRTRGGEAAKLPPDSFITYVQNHDQIGNRSDAMRIAERVSSAQLDFMHFVKFLAPEIPLCFMGDEGNLADPFPFFFDMPEDVARAKRAGRYEQMRGMFNQDVRDGELPEPNDPSTFLSAKLSWHEYVSMPGRRAALNRFRTLARWRRERVWPLAATPCLDAKTARQGNCMIVNWVFEAGTLSMAINPTNAPADIACTITGVPVSTGEFSQHGAVLRLGAWSAAAW